MSSHQEPRNPSDREILHLLLQQGVDRHRGEELLFSRFAYFIQQAVHKYSFTDEEAFTIYSDTVLSAIGPITDGSFEGRSSLKTWLYQIFHNKCVDLLRKKTTNKRSVHRTISIPDMLLHVADSAKSIIQDMIERTDRELIKQKLNEIGENCRQILLYWAEGCSDKEIAMALDYKTADVVKTSRLRCLEKLRQLYLVNIKK